MSKKEEIMYTPLGYGTDYLFGYVKRKKYIIENTLEQICAFIMEFRDHNVEIKNFLNVSEITTSMGFLHYVSNQRYLAQSLLPALGPMQEGNVEVPKYIPYVPDFKKNDKQKSINKFLRTIKPYEFAKAVKELEKWKQTGQLSMKGTFINIHRNYGEFMGIESEYDLESLKRTEYIILTECSKRYKEMMNSKRDDTIDW